MAKDIIKIYPLSVDVNVKKTSGIGRKDGSLEILASGGLGGYIINVNGKLNTGNILTGLASGEYNILVNNPDSGQSISLTKIIEDPVEPTYCTRFFPFRNFLNDTGDTTCDYICSSSTLSLTFFVYTRGNTFGELNSTLYRGSSSPDSKSKCEAGINIWPSGDTSYRKLKYNNFCHSISDLGVVTGRTKCSDIVTASGGTWAIENLKVTTFRDGTEIPFVASTTDLNNISGPAYTYYNFNSGLGDIYGYLYNYAAITDARNLAPNGYHIPTKTEWDNIFLASEINGVSGGGKLKERNLWFEPNLGAEDLYNFSLVGGGGLINNNFINNKINGYYWTTTNIGSANKNYIGLFSYNELSMSYIENIGLNSFYSVRLKKD